MSLTTTPVRKPLFKRVVQLQAENRSVAPVRRSYRTISPARVADTGPPEGLLTEQRFHGPQPTPHRTGVIDLSAFEARSTTTFSGFGELTEDAIGAILIGGVGAWSGMLYWAYEYNIPDAIAAYAIAITQLWESIIVGILTAIGGAFVSGVESLFKSKKDDLKAYIAEFAAKKNKTFLDYVSFFAHAIAP